MITEKEYAKVHQWLINKYGSAHKCSNKKCLKKSQIFQWALLHGKDYEMNRKNFRQLCVKCHAKYDWNKNRGDKVIRTKYRNIRISAWAHDKLLEIVFKSRKKRVTIIEVVDSLLKV